MGHLIVSILFVLFAAVQYNDPDAFIWIPVYLVVAIVAFLAFRKRLLPTYFLRLLTLAYLIAVLWYIPECIQWIQDGLPSITGSMQAESPYIEFVREFFGLVLCFIVLLYYLLKSKN